MSFSLVALIPLGLIVVILFLRDRQLDDQLAFPRHRPDDPEFARIDSILNEINSEPTRLKFFAERCITIDLDGAPVRLIYGTIGGASAGDDSWAKDKGAFCLVDRETQSLIYQDTRLFEHLYEGHRHSIYRANIPRILARQKAAAGLGH